jgi:hypothetical protein
MIRFPEDDRASAPKRRSWLKPLSLEVWGMNWKEANANRPRAHAKLCETLVKRFVLVLVVVLVLESGHAG